jgi:TonB-dependent starch-binding outer membrane protein SusC
MKKRIFTLFFACLVAFSMQAQQAITGKVLDLANGEAIPGANVLIKGSNTGTVSDLDGNFKVSASVGDVLVVSFVGYLSEEVEVQGTSPITVKLVADIQSLDELVVIGYGTMRKSDLTGSVAAINADDLRNIPAAGVDRALQGRVAGVNINANGGAPGAKTTIRIRGMGSIYSGNDPLFVVDGIPMASDTKIENVVNPSDIERIDILKDAASAAIYGSRGSNGVVLITTKRGQAGKAILSFNAYGGVQNPVNSPNLADAEEYVRLTKLAHLNGGRAVPAFFNSKAEGEWGKGTNWWEEILREGGGRIQNDDLS